MEPIYQLNKTAETLASAKDAINLSYTDAALPVVFFSSLSRQYWLTWLGSVNMILTYICTAFAAETVYISTTGDAPCYAENASLDSRRSFVRYVRVYSGFDLQTPAPNLWYLRRSLEYRWYCQPLSNAIIKGLGRLSRDSI